MKLLRAGYPDKSAVHIFHAAKMVLGVGALLIGLIAGLGRVSKNKVVYTIATLYVQIIRGIPILVQLMFIAFVFSPMLVDAINAHGPLAIGVSGEDVVVASVRDPELGFVGDVAAVDVIALQALVAQGSIPVVAPLGNDAAGQTYNINADTVAGAIAAALGASKLVYLTDIDGLRRVVTDATSLIRETTADELAAMLTDGSIGTGMIPKVQSCIDAVRAGVEQAHILDGRVPHALRVLLTDELIGTVVR